MYDLTVDNTISIATNNAEAKNFISIVVVVIALFIFYQLVIFIYLSIKANKFKKLKKDNPILNGTNSSSKTHVRKQETVTPNPTDRQDDIRTLLRGKR